MKRHTLFLILGLLICSKFLDAAETFHIEGPIRSLCYGAFGNFLQESIERGTSSDTQQLSEFLYRNDYLINKNEIVDIASLSEYPEIDVTYVIGSGKNLLLHSEVKEFLEDYFDILRCYIASSSFLVSSCTLGIPNSLTALSSNSLRLSFPTIFFNITKQPSMTRPMLHIDINAFCVSDYTVYSFVVSIYFPKGLPENIGYSACGERMALVFQKSKTYAKHGGNKKGAFHILKAVLDVTFSIWASLHGLNIVNDSHHNE